MQRAHSLLKSETAEFDKAVRRLEEALAQKKDDFLRDSVIQRFEFCVELAWKTAKKVMGTSTTAPKDVIRELAQAGYINDVTLWLTSIDKRNLSSHSYKEEIAEDVYLFAKNFTPHLKMLSKKLNQK
jgi:nucleotidyltransferase substrate binding protein (TIGR01987 family)